MEPLSNAKSPRPQKAGPGRNFFEAPLPREILGRRPQEIFTSAYQDRAGLNERTAEAFRSFHLMDVPGDGSDSHEQPIKDGLVYAATASAADAVSQSLFPEMTWMFAEALNPEAGLIADAVQELLWRFFNNEMCFPDRMYPLIQGVMLYPGVLARVKVSQVYSDYLKTSAVFPDFDWFGFDDFVLVGSKDPRKCLKVMRWSTSAMELRAEAGEDGLYDPEAVERAVALGNEPGPASGLTQALAELRAGRSTAVPGTGKPEDQLTVFESIGPLCDPNTGKQVADGAWFVVSSCSGVCLRAEPLRTPRMADPTVFFSLPVPPEGGPYGSCMGYLLSHYERRVNLLGTYADLGTAWDAAPPWMVKEQLISRFPNQFPPRPNGVLVVDDTLGSDQITSLKNNPNTSSAMGLMEMLRRRGEMCVGVTTPMQGGQLPASMAATLASLQSQGGQTRMAQLVRRLRKPTHELLQLMAAVFLSELEDDNPLLVRLSDGSDQTVTAAEIRKSVFRIQLDGITDAVISQARLQGVLQMMQLILGSPEMAKGIDFPKLREEIFSLMPFGKTVLRRILAQPDGDAAIMAQLQELAQQMAAPPPQPTPPAGLPPEMAGALSAGQGLHPDLNAPPAEMGGAW